MSHPSSEGAAVAAASQAAAAAAAAAEPARAAVASTAAPAGASATASAAASAAAPAAATGAVPKPRGWGFGRYLRARIGTEQLTLELFANRRKPRLLGRVTQGTLADRDGAGASLPTDIVQAISALGPALAALEAGAAARGERGVRGLLCDVIIDDAWMLYDVVRADLRGLSPRAADALIGASLADVAGVSASELVSRWQPQGDSPYTLACGLPATALPALTETLRAHRVGVGSVEGEFVLEFNRYRQNLEPKCSVIAVVREAGAQLAVLIDGVLTAMSFEFGVGAPKELELRGRGLLRVAGVGGDGAVRFIAISPPGWKAPEPWVCLPATA